MKHVISSCRSLAVASVVTALSLAGCGSPGATNSWPVSAQQKLGPASDLHIADSALSSGNTELALTLYDKALQAKPDSIEAQLGLADTVYQAGDLERARVLYARTADSAPSNLRSKLGLARVALRQRRLDDASALYRSLAAQLPDNPVTAEGLGTVLDLQGRHDEAQAVYRAALRAHPEAQGLTTDLGLSLILANKPREAANVLLEIAGLANARRRRARTLRSHMRCSATGTRRNRSCRPTCPRIGRGQSALLRDASLETWAADWSASRHSCGRPARGSYSA